LQSAQYQSDQANSQERLLKHLTGSPQGQPSKHEGAFLKMTAIATELDHNTESDDEKVSPTVEYNNGTPDETLQEEKQVEKMKPKDVLPQGYAKASTFASTCVHGNNTSKGYIVYFVQFT
jgi:hypothetical protein